MNRRLIFLSHICSAELEKQSIIIDARRLIVNVTSTFLGNMNGPSSSTSQGLEDVPDAGSEPVKIAPIATELEDVPDAGRGPAIIAPIAAVLEGVPDAGRGPDIIAPIATVPPHDSLVKEVPNAGGSPAVTLDPIVVPNAGGSPAVTLDPIVVPNAGGSPAVTLDPIVTLPHDSPVKQVPDAGGKSAVTLSIVTLPHNSPVKEVSDAGGISSVMASPKAESPDGVSSADLLSCNRRIRINNSSTKKRKCGRQPVVMHHQKQKYCEFHHKEYKEWRKAQYQNSKENMKENTGADKGYIPSMSMLCALSDDGFYLDIIPGSHKRNDVQPLKMHCSDLDHIHVPQTYFVLFNKWCYHGGSEYLHNLPEVSSQQRLFAYMTTRKTSHVGADTTLDSDKPQPDVTFSPRDFLCVSRSCKTWKCASGCDENKLKIKATEKEINITAPQLWDQSLPGTIVAGNLEKVGYVIIRSSIVKEECEIMLDLEEYLTEPWDDITGYGGLPKIKKGRREQFPLDRLEIQPAKPSKGKKKKEEIPKMLESSTLRQPCEKLFNRFFNKLMKDIVLTFPSFAIDGKCSQEFTHKKVLRNMGKTRQQYPHCDYERDGIERSKRQDMTKKRKR
jgi:hypothetical protein